MLFYPSLDLVPNQSLSTISKCIYALRKSDLYFLISKVLPFLFKLVKAITKSFSKNT